MTSTPEEAARKMLTWQTQAIDLLKRALRNPDVMQETILDIGEPLEVQLTVMAHERVKLILPAGMERSAAQPLLISFKCKNKKHGECDGLVAKNAHCECRCHRAE